MWVDSEIGGEYCVYCYGTGRIKRGVFYEFCIQCNGTGYDENDMAND